MLNFLRFIRGIFGIVAIWQVFGLLPVAGWLKNLGGVTAEMWVFLAIKLFALFVFTVPFFALRTLINHLHSKKFGTPHPALASKWSF